MIRPTTSSDSVDLVLKRIKEIPSLPEVVNNVIQLLGQPGSSAAEIARLISYDPGLTSKILRMVNSSAYGFQRQISSVQHAIMLLGFNTVRGLVLSASLFKLFQGRTQKDGLNHYDFWTHCLSTATMAKAAGRVLKMPDNEDIFSAGVLHDIGKIILDIYFGTEYVNVLKTARGIRLPFHGNSFLQLESNILNLTHPQIGGMLAQKWKLPMSLTEAILYHHAPHEAHHCKPLVYLIALGNQLSSAYNPKNGLFAEGAVSPDIVDYFQLDEDLIQNIFDEIEDSFASINDLMSDLSTDSDKER